MSVVNKYRKRRKKIGLYCTRRVVTQITSIEANEGLKEVVRGWRVLSMVTYYETLAHTYSNKVGVIQNHPFPLNIPIDGDEFFKCLEDYNFICNSNSITWNGY